MRKFVILKIKQQQCMARAALDAVKRQSCEISSMTS